ncbi:MAG: hypothetical protein DCC75_11485, partial [Proteobacteria bacterium]
MELHLKIGFFFIFSCILAALPVAAQEEDRFFLKKIAKRDIWCVVRNTKLLPHFPLKSGELRPFLKLISSAKRRLEASSSQAPALQSRITRLKRTHRRLRAECLEQDYRLGAPPATPTPNGAPQVEPKIFLLKRSRAAVETLDFSPSGSDPEGEDLTFEIAIPPLGGVLTLEEGGSHASYLPNQGFAGVDSFYISANDGLQSSPPAKFEVIVPPVPRAKIAPYIPWGGLHIESGAPSQHPASATLIAAMPALSQYGFGYTMSPDYSGTGRSIQDAARYYGPLVTAARQAGMVGHIPGFWLHYITHQAFGYIDESPLCICRVTSNTSPAAQICNANPSIPICTSADWYTSHPMNLTGLLERTFWEELVAHSLRLAGGADSHLVYWDAESPLWDNRFHPTFWSDQNLGIIRDHFEWASEQLARQGVFLVHYHPNHVWTLPNMVKMARWLFSPIDPRDPSKTSLFLAALEVEAPSPYFDPAVAP